MLDFGQFDFGQFEFGELAEVEIDRSRNWPKSKLVEVGINWLKSNNWCSLCFFFVFFFLCFIFSLCFTFFLFLLISLFILFLCCFCFRPPKK